MRNLFSFYINRFFLSGEIYSFHGLKHFRYRILFILEPVFFILAILSSMFVQKKILEMGLYNFLLVFYLIQVMLILSIYYSKLNRVSRSFSLYVLLLVSLFTSLSLYDIPINLYIFLAVMISSLFFTFKRTSFVFFLFVINISFLHRDELIQYLYSPYRINFWDSILYFTLFSSFITGLILSVIVYFLEKSLSSLDQTRKSLNHQNNKFAKVQDEKREFKDALVGNELRFKTILEYAFDGITILDKEGNNKFVSNSTEKITGYSPEEFEGGALSFDKIHPDDAARVIENFRNISENRLDHSTIYYRSRHKDGDWRNLEVSVTNLLDNPGVEGILFVYRDVTKHIRAEQRARYFEFYDQLTGLPNQLMFSDKISEELERSAARNRSFAVMCLGINNFKDINGVFGTSFGDMALKQIGSRLKSNFRGDDFVSRMMGDKFLILFSDMKSEDDVIAIVQKTMNSFDTPFWIENRDLLISVSIGISVYPNDALRKDELIKNSETALFSCKESRDRKYCMFNKNQNDDLIYRIQIEKDILKAIESKAFTVYYQPKVNSHGDICGAEALIRWFTADKGMISPGIFIPICERNRSIIEIGKIIIEKTYTDMKSWREKGYEPVKISINVAPMQFSDPHFIDTIKTLEKKFEIDTAFVEFEITETGLMENENHTLFIMEQLISSGYSISIDDFGTGYSSLNKLKDYPVHTLKIDKSFIDSIPENLPSCNIVKTIIELAHFLDFQVVAEGVEKENQAALLNSYQCDLIQGFLYHKPMPFNKFIKLLKKS